MLRRDYAVNEVGEMLGVSNARVYQLLTELKIERQFIPGSRQFFLIRAEDVERMKSRNTLQGRPKKNNSNYEEKA